MGRNGSKCAAYEFTLRTCNRHGHVCFLMYVYRSDALKAGVALELKIESKTSNTHAGNDRAL